MQELTSSTCRWLNGSDGDDDDMARRSVGNDDDFGTELGLRQAGPCATAPLDDVMCSVAELLCSDGADQSVEQARASKAPLTSEEARRQAEAEGVPLLEARRRTTGRATTASS